MTCAKLGYPTKREAKRALDLARGCRQRHGADHIERRIYRCRCRLYHLTSQPHRRFEPVASAAMLEGVAA